MVVPLAVWIARHFAETAQGLCTGVAADRVGALVAVLPQGAAVALAEGLGEVRDTVEADGVGDFADRTGVLAQQLGGAIQPEVADQVAGRLAGQLADAAEQVAAVLIHRRGQVSDLEGLVGQSGVQDRLQPLAVALVLVGHRGGVGARRGLGPGFPEDFDGALNPVAIRNFEGFVSPAGRRVVSRDESGHARLSAAYPTYECENRRGAPDPTASLLAALDAGVEPRRRAETVG